MLAGAGIERRLEAGAIGRDRREVSMIVEGGVILAGRCAPASIYAAGLAFSADLGRTWSQYDLAEFGPRSPVRFRPKNSDGWFRVDLRKGWIERGEVLSLKPKP